MSVVTASVGGVELASMPAASAIFVEGNQYFPPSALQMKYFKPSVKDLHTYCPWKGHASYYDIHLDDGTVLADSAWFYPGPTSDKAKHFEGYVAFYKDRVDVVG